MSLRYCYIFLNHLLLGPFQDLAVSCACRRMGGLHLYTIIPVANPCPACTVSVWSITTLGGLTSFSVGVLPQRRTPSPPYKVRPDQRPLHTSDKTSDSKVVFLAADKGTLDSRSIFPYQARDHPTKFHIVKTKLLLLNTSRNTEPCPEYFPEISVIFFVHTCAHRKRNTWLSSVSRS